MHKQSSDILHSESDLVVTRQKNPAELFDYL